jgi:lipopolysaccharide export system permease protein
VKLYKKYVLSETTIACGVAVVLFVAVLLAANAIRDIIEWIAMGRLTIPEALKILWMLTPSAISYALPLGMMTGILATIGAMSSQNEILALKSIGIGLREICHPIFLLATAFTLLSAYVNLYHAPNSTDKYRQSFSEIVRNKPMRFVVPKTFNGYFANHVIYVDSISDGNFNGMKIWQMDDGKRLNMYISAGRGKMSFDGAANSFTLELNGGSAEKFDTASTATTAQKPQQIVFFENISVSIPASDFLGGKTQKEKKLHHMNLNELLKEKRKLANLEDRREADRRRTLINAQISGNIARAVGNLVMAVLAIPFGVGMARSETALNAGCALALCLGYYFTMTIFSLFGENTSIRPDILIWIPNIALMALGISLFKRASRH